MTLIVISEGSVDEVGETLAQLMRDHPSRLIVLRLEAGAALKARVLAQCWMPFGRRQQICCEQIEITASREELAQVPPLVGGLLVPDLPVSIWCRSGFTSYQEWQSVLDLGGKVIVDSQAMPDLLAQVGRIQTLRAQGHRVGDLAWTRLTRWRESIAQIFDDAECMENLAGIQTLRIGYQGWFVPMSAFYLAAWLDQSLGQELSLDLYHSGNSNRARVQSVELVGEGARYWISVGQDRSLEMHGSVRNTHGVLRLPSEYDLLREELSVMAPDPVYESVINVMPALVGRYSS
jgi:glucose-6-phosphate dehydrogenase assembly protein OpcA